MKKNISKSILILMCLILATSIAGCSNKTSPVKMDSTNIQSDINQANVVGEANPDYVSDDQSAETDESTAFVGTGEASNAVNNSILSQRKIIRNANISVTVENFDVAYSKIEYIISTVGFIQESKLAKTKHYVNGNEVLVTGGVIVVRVDADKFSSVLKDIKGLGLLTDEDMKTEDVTEKFFDVESRLRLLKYEESRLEEYLKKIEDPDTIFKTESRLTDLRHEIEQLTGTLNKLSDLVKLSTITINMNEELPYAEPTPAPSYLEQLTDNFSSSLGGVIEFLGNFLILIVSALPVLLLLAIAALAFLPLFRHLFKNKRNKGTTTNKSDKPVDDKDNQSDQWLVDKCGTTS